jgi:4'-phosphopantetheinyl transferase
MDSLDSEVHIYLLNLAAETDLSYAQAWAVLNSEEQARAGRIRHELTQRAFVRVRASLRILLGRYLRVAPSSIRFAFGGKGKPRLAGSEPDCGLVFNVSHSGDLGLIALALDTALGVDVERHRYMPNKDGMAERCFAESELAWWRALPEALRALAFFDLWSCKEAFVKATGEGIALGLETCVVDLHGPPKLLAIPPNLGAVGEWRLNLLDLEAGYASAVCYQGAPRRVRLAQGVDDMGAL